MTPTAHNQQESKDSIGIGKISEGQLKAVLEMVKRKNLLREPAPEPTGGRGIVIAGGGKYEQWSLVNCMWIRQQGITCPIQLWHLGKVEISARLRPHFEALGVELVDAHEMRQKHWMRKLGGWELKAYCAARCPFDEVCFVDADCLLSADPSKVWDDWDYQQAGALFFSDVAPCRKGNWHYVYAGVPVPEAEFESGVFFWNRQKCWAGILFTMWILEHSDEWFKLSHGDKEMFYLGFGASRTPFIQSRECLWAGWGISQGWKGLEITMHCMAYKRNEAKSPSPVIDRLFEQVRSLR